MSMNTSKMNILKSKQFNTERLDFEVNSCRAFLLKPINISNNKSRPWIFFAPAFMGPHPTNPQINPANCIHPVDVDTPVDPPDREDRSTNAPLFKVLLEYGFHIAGIEVGESYGNPAGRQHFSSFYELLIKEDGLCQKVCFYGSSRGGLMIYNWAVENPERVCCIGLNQPVCDLRSFPGIMTAGDAYPMTANELAANIAKHNPIDRLEPLVKHNIPLFHIHGDADTLVPFENNTGELARRYKALGGEIEVIKVPGVEHGNWAELNEDMRISDFFFKHTQVI